MQLEDQRGEQPDYKARGREHRDMKKISKQYLKTSVGGNQY